LGGGRKALWGRGFGGVGTAGVFGNGWGKKPRNHGDPGHGNHTPCPPMRRVQVARSAASSALASASRPWATEASKRASSSAWEAATPGCFGASGVAKSKTSVSRVVTSQLADVREVTGEFTKGEGFGMGTQSSGHPARAPRCGARRPFRTRIPGEGSEPNSMEPPGRLPVYFLMPSIRRKDTDGRVFAEQRVHEV